MKRLVMVLFASAAFAVAGCTSSSTTGSSPAATTPAADKTPTGGADTNTVRIKIGGTMPSTSTAAPKIEIP